MVVSLSSMRRRVRKETYKCKSIYQVLRVKKVPDSVIDLIDSFTTVEVGFAGVIYYALSGNFHCFEIDSASECWMSKVIIRCDYDKYEDLWTATCGGFVWEINNTPLDYIKADISKCKWIGYSKGCKKKGIYYDEGAGYYVIENS